MGLRFRKSIKAGPVRINLSKSGVGYSVGTKGYRVTKTANGRIRKTASIPGTGISHVTETSIKKKDKTDHSTEQSAEQSSKQTSNKKPKKSKKKIILIVIAILFVIGLIGSMTSEEEPKLESMTISDVDRDMEIDEIEEIGFTIDPEDGFTLNNATFETDDSDVAILSFEDGKLYVEAVGAGTTSLWIEMDGVKSNKIDVTVSKPEEPAAEPQEEPSTQQSSGTSQQSSGTSSGQSGSQSNQSSSGQSNSSSSSQSTPVQEPVEEPSAPVETTPGAVYIAGSGSGTKYHSNPDCSNMSNPIAISLAEAQAQGYEPCKRCY